MILWFFFFQGSKFYENELKKDQQVNQRIEKMMQLKEKITAQQLLKAQLQVLIFWRLIGVNAGSLTFWCVLVYCIYSADRHYVKLPFDVRHTRKSAQYFGGVILI